MPGNDFGKTLNNKEAAALCAYGLAKLEYGKLGYTTTEPLQIWAKFSCKNKHYQKLQR